MESNRIVSAEKELGKLKMDLMDDIKQMLTHFPNQMVKLDREGGDDVYIMIYDDYNDIEEYLLDTIQLVDGVIRLECVNKYLTDNYAENDPFNYLWVNTDVWGRIHDTLAEKVNLL